METQIILLFILAFLLLTLFLVQSVISCGISQTSDEINTANSDIETTTSQNVSNSASISTLQTKTQNMSATPGVTNFTGTVNVSNSLVVNGVDVNQSIQNIENSLSSGEITISSLTVNDLVANTITANQLNVEVFVPSKGILLSPCAYLMDTANGNPSNDKDFLLEGLPLAIAGTTGSMVGISDCHGCILNPGFAMRIFEYKNYVTERGYFVNTWSSPAVYLTNGDNYKNTEILSVIVYYNGKIFNPFAFGTNPQTGTAAIPTAYQSPPTTSIVAAQGTPFYS